MFRTWIIRQRDTVWVHKLADIVTSLWLGIIALLKELFYEIFLCGNLLTTSIWNKWKCERVNKSLDSHWPEDYYNLNYNNKQQISTVNLILLHYPLNQWLLGAPGHTTPVYATPACTTVLHATLVCTLPVHDWLRLPTTTNQPIRLLLHTQPLCAQPLAMQPLHAQSFCTNPCAHNPCVCLASSWLVKAPHHSQSDYPCMHNSCACLASSWLVKAPHHNQSYYPCMPNPCMCNPCMHLASSWLVKAHQHNQSDYWVFKISLT